jgi:Cu/Ag efflux protein CusF
MRKAWAAAVVVALSLAMLQGCAEPAALRAGGYAAEITHIELAEKRLTLKGSMGQLTVRVAPGVALHTFKPGDKVQITFGQEGTEPSITHMEPSQR